MLLISPSRNKIVKRVIVLCKQLKNGGQTVNNFVTHSFTHLRALFIVHSNVFDDSSKFRIKLFVPSASVGIIWQRRCRRSCNQRILDLSQEQNSIKQCRSCKCKLIIEGSPSLVQALPLVILSAVSKNAFTAVYVSQFTFCTSFFPTFQSYRFQKHFLKICLVPFL